MPDRRLHLPLTVLVVLLAGCDAAPTPPAARKPTVVVVSADTAGWLTPCGCASNQSGGLPRRGTYLAQLRATADVLYLDAGGAAGGTSDYHRERFDAILAGEKLVGVAAHNLGKSELALGAPSLRDTAKRLDVPLVGANTTDPAGHPIAPASRTVTLAGKSFLIIGVVSPKYASADIRVSDPRQAVLDALKTRSENQSALVLAYLPEDELKAFAASLPEVDAVVGGPTGQAVAPHRVGPVLLAAATNKGKFLVTLDPPAEPTAAWDGKVVELAATYADAPPQLDNVKAYLARLEKRDFAAGATGLVDPLPPGTPRDFRIAGSASCAACHNPDQHVWTGSKHSHAMDTLKQKGFHVDSYCQSCHTTGFALPGGFDRLSDDAAKNLFGVGCENCHGPSAAHVKNPKTRTPWLAADQCVRCHDHENSPKFDYATYWPRIVHGKKGENR